ncbi:MULTISPECIES: ATP-binding protein [Streptomyces]|uniref:ATP-binding protein n=1 Tax=Streptomyces TaxID=1883 RepID=UPI00226DE330|nr:MULTISPECIES: ATP-binding protein [unclassified Streptomyces]MCY0940375.1 ATP-binding protein [Streptomyces sp. H34-AA3]MCY0950747.1 ATP-binding protein [Streptomyces sp. H27-S2]MCZ4083890.1 ATP-binding protein [Streptomyces sp. H34-S5]
MTGTLRGLRPVREILQIPPEAEKLNYSIGLHGSAYCAGTARSVVRPLLTRHGLSDLRDAAALAASELVACAHRFTPDTEMVLKVRWQFDALRIVVYDQHPAHSSPEAREECRSRRNRGMWLLAATVETCGGDWGLTPVLTATGGTKSWALLPRQPKG